MLHASCHPPVVPYSQSVKSQVSAMDAVLYLMLSSHSYISISSAFLYLCPFCWACINDIFNASSLHNINYLSLSKLNFSPMTTPLKVVVVGGGIAGLTLANALEVRYLVYYHQRDL